MTSVQIPESGEVGLSQTSEGPAPRRSRRKLFAVLTGLFLAVVCLVMLSPFLWAMMSVTKPTDVAFANPPVFAYRPTLAAFVDLWQTTDFYKYLINTVVVAVISTIVSNAPTTRCRSPMPESPLKSGNTITALLPFSHLM